jgi:membrane protein YqaA with SNARE-associated domain
MPAWILQFGLAGVFAVAFLDAAPIPLPIPGSTDILILILGVHGESPWLLAPVAIAGSLLGAWFTWSAGKKGGEAMIERYMPKRFRSRIERWIKSHGVLSVCLPRCCRRPFHCSHFCWLPERWASHADSSSFPSASRALCATGAKPRWP